MARHMMNEIRFALPRSYKPAQQALLGFLKRLLGHERGARETQTTSSRSFVFQIVGASDCVTIMQIRV